MGYYRIGRRSKKWWFWYILDVASLFTVTLCTLKWKEELPNTVNCAAEEPSD